MVSVFKGIFYSSVEMKKLKEQDETFEEWKRGFLAVVQGGNHVEKLQQCFVALPSCSAQFSDDADEAAKTNRGTFILKTLHNSNELCVREFLFSQGEAEDVVCALKTQGYFTPYFLRDIQAVRCMVQNKCTFPRPGKGRAKEENDTLDSALTALNSYVAIADPIYIAECFLNDVGDITDPLQRAFELGRELSIVSRIEYEFKSEYKKLSERCNKFAVDILENCSMEPDIRCVLESGSEITRNETLDILHLAVLNDNVQVSVYVPGHHFPSGLIPLVCSTFHMHLKARIAEW